MCSLNEERVVMVEGFGVVMGSVRCGSVGMVWDGVGVGDLDNVMRLNLKEFDKFHICFFGNATPSLIKI